MKKSRIICAVTAAVMAFSVTGVFAGCTNETGDSETTPFVMATQKPDGVFNPFFSTSQYDSNIVSWTQLSMFSSDKEGQLVAGENEACVVKDWTSSWDENEDNGIGGKGVTTYRLAIKNGIMFSDGVHELTIKDVLFNLYTYLDPAYTGSSTIYSTKFVGLEAYRTGGEYITEAGSSTFEEGFVSEANARIKALNDYVHDFHDPKPSAPNRTDWDTKTDDYGRLLKEVAQEDYVIAGELFKEELNSDYTNVVTGMESYTVCGFSSEEAWAPYLMNEIGAQMFKQEMNSNGIEVNAKDEEGNYIFDPVDSDYPGLKEELNEYLTAHNANDANRATLTQEWAVDYVYSGFFPEGGIAKTPVQDFQTITTMWATADKLRTRFAAEAKRDYFNDPENRKVTTVSGITTERASSITGDNGTKNLGEECDILVVKVRGVDPKALWNLAFPVAPMYYYSGTWKGTNYIEAFDAASGNFGLPFSDPDFMSQVINSPDKVGLPVGAGPYMASSRNGGPATKGSDFYDLGTVYYERNTSFHTVGDGIENAKIKNMQYKEIAAEQYVNAVPTVDYADPSATQKNMEMLDENGVRHEEYLTSGYGYIGINPRYIPSRVVRRAIMKSFNTATIFNDYYQGGLAQPIYRPMSLANWAYPKGATTYIAQDGTSYGYDGTGVQIKKMLDDYGFVDSNKDGIREDLKGNKLSYTFTIAGASIDHPAYQMFLDSRDLLADCGIEVKVVQSAQALSDLTTGKLQVWAAAWSSTVDPDMYQVYHKDSKATSVNNWGYPYIKADDGKTYGFEQGIIETLSTLIDQGRQTDDITKRMGIYKDALDLVMELAVEFPTYQRNDMFAYSNRINRNTMTNKDDCGPYNGLLARIWEVDFNH